MKYEVLLAVISLTINQSLTDEEVPEKLHVVKPGPVNKNIINNLKKESTFDEVAGSELAAFQVWNENTCSDVLNLFTVTSKAIQSIKGEIRAKSRSTDTVVQLKVRALQMLADDLVESERWIFSALHMLKETVKSSAANSLDRIVKNAKSRLEELKYATLKEEQKFDKLGIILGQIRDIHHKTGEHSLFYDIIKDLLTDVESAADTLEDTLREKIVPFRSDDIETVKKLPENADDELSQILQDIHGNRYVISLPADKTQPLTDSALLYSLTVILSFAGIFSGVCHILSIPTIFGQILAGMVVGPTCLNFIMAPVQTEAVGEIGVFLILFACGLECSPFSLIKVWRISICGSLSIIVLITLVCVLCGSVFNISVYQSIFVALCLSFSSTALIIKFLRDDKGEDVKDLRDSMIGMLVLQDIEVSVIVGCLPLLAGHDASHHSVTERSTPVRKLLNLSPEDTSWSSSQLILISLFSVICIGVVAALLIKLFKPKASGVMLRLFNRPTNTEVETLLPLSLCFIISLFFSRIGISMEVGCFLSGVLLKSLNRAEQTMKMIEPVHDIFGVIFFTTLGLHVFPSFVWSQKYLIILLTIIVVGIKYLVCLLVLKPLTSELQRTVISAGLAQVSEFSFVLASRGRKLRLVNREVYLLILSITTGSLILSPIIWKTSLIHARSKKEETAHVL